jgi:hypothetical protein
MSIKLISVNAVKVVTALVLVTSLGLTSCGKKDKTETTETTTTTTSPAANTAPSTAPAASTAPATGTAAPLSATEKTQFTGAKVALVAANSAVKTGNIAVAKTQFDKFSAMLPMIEPIIKAKAGANYPAIESALNMVKTAMGSATPDKAKAGEGLTKAIQGMTAMIDKK